MSISEAIIVVSLTSILIIGGLARNSHLPTQASIDAAAESMNSAAILYLKDQQCNFNFGTTPQIQVTVAQLVASGALAGDHLVNVSDGIGWSVTYTSRHSALVTANSTNKKFLTRLANKFRGEITGNQVSYSVIPVGGVGYDPHIVSFKEINGGPCHVMSAPNPFPIPTP